MKILKPVLFGILLSSISCNKFKASSAGDTSLASLMGEGAVDLNPTTDRLDATCASNSDYDTCVVLKNPVAQKQSATTQAQLEFGVKLRGLRPVEGLENPTFAIRTIKTPRLNPYMQSLKPQWSETTSGVEQLNTYYWLNRFVSYLHPRLSGLKIYGKGISVVVDDAFNGWSRAKNSIHLKRETGKVPSALQGELAIYFLAQAEADYSTQGALDLSATDTLHNLCGADPRGCCKTQAGCSKALRSAAGDYFVAMMFPNWPRVGETLSQNVQGQNQCGWSRDLAWLSTKNVSQAYSACQSAGRAGDVYVMGALYASIWWEIRNQAAGQWSDGALIVDQFFHLHMAQWTSTDTFLTAKAKAQSIVHSFHHGLLAALVDDVFAERGL